MKLGLAVVALIACGADAFVASSAFAGRQVAHAATSCSTCTTSMKLYDWKRRADDSANTSTPTVDVTTIVPSPGSTHRHARKGRGIAAGQGASCGFGMRGQRSRSGPGVRAGFEGGQQPLYRRLPKFTGRPMGPGHTKKQFNLLHVGDLNAAEEGSTVNFDSLFGAKAVTKSKHRWHKVVGGGELTTKGLTVQAHAFTQSAVEAIEGAGGSCQLLSPTTNEVLVMEE
ncbi:unnamed protein product [Chrysoparadoxa australica]